MRNYFIKPCFGFCLFILLTVINEAECQTENLVNFQEEVFGLDTLENNFIDYYYHDKFDDVYILSYDKVDSSVYVSKINLEGEVSWHNHYSSLTAPSSFYDKRYKLVVDNENEEVVVFSNGFSYRIGFDGVEQTSRYIGESSYLVYANSGLDYFVSVTLDNNQITSKLSSINDTITTVLFTDLDTLSSGNSLPELEVEQYNFVSSGGLFDFSIVEKYYISPIRQKIFRFSESSLEDGPIQQDTQISLVPTAGFNIYYLLMYGYSGKRLRAQRFDSSLTVDYENCFEGSVGGNYIFPAFVEFSETFTLIGPRIIDCYANQHVYFTERYYQYGLYNSAAGYSVSNFYNKLYTIKLDDVDEDGDGFYTLVDCDDLDSLINPAAEEIVNNDIDDNCDGYFAIDFDLDGYEIDVDCDDMNAEVNSGVEEIVNNDIDDNCDGYFAIDFDLDGYEEIFDCDDMNADVNSGMAEILFNGIDDDCNNYTNDTTEICLVGSTEFSDQDDINAFAIEYGGCDVIIDGNLNFTKPSDGLPLATSVLKMIVGITSNLETEGVSIYLERLIFVEGSIACKDGEEIKLPQLELVSNVDFEYVENFDLTKLREVTSFHIYKGSFDTLDLSGLEKVNELEIDYINGLVSMEMNHSLEISERLVIRNNFDLNICAIRPICEFMASSSGALIYSNGDGCDSEEEVISLCIDEDNDTWYQLEDCNDQDSLINPSFTHLI